MNNEEITDYKERMQKALGSLQRDFSGVRAGRASTSMLDPIRVDAYGSMMPINQVGNITAPEPKLLMVQVWDAGLVKQAEKAIRESNLGVNPAIDGQTIRVSLPDLNEERRAELTKIVAKYAEDGRIAVRAIRRDGIEKFRKQEKAKEISEDNLHRLEGSMQKITDEHVKKVDDMLSSKQKDIMQV